MKRMTVTFVVLGLLDTGLSTRTNAQAKAIREKMHESPDCSPCIVAKQYLTLGQKGGTHPLQSQVVAMSRLRDSGYVVTQIDGADGRALLFDSTSRYLGTLGRRGSLPGEFAYVRRVVSLGREGLVIVDPALQRVTIVDSAYHLRSQRQLPDIALGFDLIRLDRARKFVSNASLPTRQLAGKPLHVYSDNLSYERSIGPKGALFRIDRARLLRRRLTSSPDGESFWSADPYHYAIEHLRTDGTVLTTIRPQRTWFPELGDRESPEKGAVEPQTEVAAVHESIDKQLWVVILLPDSSWRSAVKTREAVRDGRLRSIFEIENFDKYFDTIVEVFDVNTLKLIASRRFDEAITLSIEDGLFAGRVTEPMDPTLYDCGGSN